jgi:hypothetical protein
MEFKQSYRYQNNIRLIRKSVKINKKCKSPGEGNINAVSAGTV